MTVQEKQYLTVSEVTRLLRIDKSTVYRMAEDGRLSGVKVGRQWRFLAEELERAFGVDLETESPAPGVGPDGAAALTSLFAELYGVMAVVTDLEGRPLTPIMNPSSYFDLISRDPEAVDTCIGEWRSHALDDGLQPNLHPSRFGFLCARAYIRSGFELVGMVIAGGVASAGWPPAPAQLNAIAKRTGVTSESLAAVAESVPRLDTQATEAMLDGLSTLARHLSQDTANLPAARSTS